jgi:hypothetical protein
MVWSLQGSFFSFLSVLLVCQFTSNRLQNLKRQFETTAADGVVLNSPKYVMINLEDDAEPTATDYFTDGGCAIFLLLPMR